MKRIYIFLLLSILSVTTFAQQHVVEFYVSNKEEIRNLPNYLSVDNYKNGRVTAYIWGDNFEKFKTLGYKFTEIDYSKNIKAIDMASTVASMANWDKYPTYEVYVQMMQNFATNYPDICKLDTIGTSQNGRLILAAKISDFPDSNEAEPDFFYTSTMHGDELLGYVLMLRLIDSLLTSYGTSQQITNLIDSVAIYINPLANPDGTYYGGNSTVANADRYLANGTDPNRDYPYPEHLNSPYSKETQDMMNYTDSHNFIVSVNFHSGAEVYNFPWDYWKSYENTHPDDDWFRYFGQKYVDTARILNSSYMTGIEASGVTEGADWYYADGSRQDYMTYYQHCKEVTIELSNTKLLSSSLLPEYWNYNKYSLTNYIHTSLQGFYGTVKNKNGQALDAKIEIQGFDKDNSWAVTNPATGAYFRPIQPGTYDVTFSADGYFPKNKSITITDWTSNTIQNVTLRKSNTISGTIIDAQTGLTIENVEINFTGDTLNKTNSNISGIYTNELYLGNYTLNVFKSAYHPITQTNYILNDTIIDFALIASNAYSFEHEIPVEITFSGDAIWTRDNTIAYDSIFSMKSGAIADNQTSTMQLDATTQAGKIFFFKKVSSDTLADSLTFFIDGIQQRSWSGEDDWTLEGFDVSAGTHTFLWTYKKDASSTAGNDCAWIDYIDLPTALPNTYSVSFNIKDGSTANPLEGADVYLTGYGKKISDASGNVNFFDVYETSFTNTLSYNVILNKYYDETGELQILGTTNQIVNMQKIPVENIELETNFKIYPNPAQNFITIETDSNFGIIFIYDITGKSILSKNIESNKNILDISFLQKGIYLMKYIGNDNIQFGKFIKE